MKIYVNDPAVPYKNTTVNAQRSKMEIDAVLALWGIKDSGWRWSPEDGEVFVTFQLREVIDGREVAPVIKIYCPTLWNKGSRRKREEVNWNVSMRVMYWYIKSHLEMAHLMQSSKTVEFLPHIQTRMLSGETVSLKDRLVEVNILDALPEKKMNERIIDITP